MDFLKRLTAQIGAYYREMQLSQKAAIGLTVVVMIAALVWMMQWSSQRVYEPLSPTTLSEEEMALVQAKLEEWNIDYRVDNGRILLPPNTRHDVSARLLEAELLPAGFNLGFQELMDNESPWLSEAEKERRWTVALSNELANTLSHMSGVKKARVFIDNRQQRRFGSPSVQPSAVVSIWPKPNFTFDRKHIHMLAAFVSGAVAGLDINRVRVIDESQGQSYTAHDPDANMAGDLLALRRSEEAHFIRKIQDRLSYIPGVLVQVFAEQETDQTQVQSTTLDKPVISKSKAETSEMVRQSPAGGPGVVPNTSVALQGGGASGERTLSETSDEEFDGERGREIRSVMSTKGVIKKFTATIGVPRSWLIGTYKRLKNTEEDPSDEALMQFERAEFDKIIQAVTKIINASADDQVAVASFPDDMQRAMQTVAVASEGPDVSGYLERYGAQAGLAMLALISIGLMLRMVRKAPIGPQIPAHLLEQNEREILDPDLPLRNRILTGENTAPLGDVFGGETMLEGHELDEHAVKTRQLVTQVAELVSKDPERASEMINRWVGQGR